MALLLLEIFVITWDITNAEALLEDLNAFRTRLMNEKIVSQTPVIPWIELSFYIHLFQTRVSLLARNEKAAKKTIKLTMQDLNKDVASSGSPFLLRLSCYLVSDRIHRRSRDGDRSCLRIP
jgi:hypothetical protein